MSGYMRWLGDKTPGAWWIDSIDPDDVKRAVSLGARGITTNPYLCARALQAKPDYWRPVLGKVPDGAVDQRAREILRRMVVHAAEWIRPVYDASGGQQGYICCQVNPKLYGDADAQIEEAALITRYAPNISVKLPVSRAGLETMEVCIGQGIAVTGTVSFTLTQANAIGEAYERGIIKARSSGIKPKPCNAVIMIGRLEDYLMSAARDMGKAELCADIPNAGVLVTKQAVTLFARKKYTAALLPSGMRGSRQIQNLAGLRGIFSISPNLADDLENQNAPQTEKLNEPLDENLVRRLSELRAFRHAYEPDGLEPDEFIGFGSFQQTITQFLESGWLRMGAFA
jgi:transaldolase